MKLFHFTLAFFFLLTGCDTTPSTSLKKQLEGTADNQKISPQALFAHPIHWEKLLKVAGKINETTIEGSKTRYIVEDSYVIVLNHELQRVNISNKQGLLNFGIEIGMKRKEFVNRFETLSAGSNNLYVIEIKGDIIRIGCCEENLRTWQFYFENDTLAKVNYY